MQTNNHALLNTKPIKLNKTMAEKQQVVFCIFFLAIAAEK